MPRITPVHWRTLEKVFLALGFQFARQVGSHRTYTKPGISRPVVIPTRQDVPVSLILSNLKTAGVSREQYLDLLAKL